MKHYLLIVCTFLTFSPVFSQFDTLSRNYLDEQGYVLSRSIIDYPESLYPENVQYVVLGIVQGETKDFIGLLFKLNDSTFLQAPTLELYDQDIFFCRDQDVEYENGEIKRECRWQRGKIYGERFELIDNHLYFKESYTYDLNEWVFIEAENAKLNNDPIAFCNAYMGAQFYSQFIDAIMQESLIWAYEQALEFAEKGAYTEAATLMHQLETECDMSLSESIADLFPGEFKKMWCNTALFYLKADMNKECMILSQTMVKLFPDFAEMYLHYGDALFNLSKISESKTIYNKYIELMKSTGNIDQIPTRVVERVKD